MYQTDMELLGQHIVRKVFPKKSVVCAIFKIRENNDQACEYVTMQVGNKDLLRNDLHDAPCRPALYSHVPPESASDGAPCRN
jgi:hypothetical protein